MTTEENSGFSAWVAAHNVRWGVLSGTVAAAWVTVVTARPVIGLPVGVGVGAFNAWIWREAGQARRLRAWMLMRFPGKPPRR
jgi:hypothetical protein